MTRPGTVSPVIRAIERCSAVVWASLLLALLLVALVVLALANPGERVGPVRPAGPPVGGSELPPP